MNYQRNKSYFEGTAASAGNSVAVAILMVSVVASLIGFGIIMMGVISEDADVAMPGVICLCIAGVVVAVAKECVRGIQGSAVTDFEIDNAYKYLIEQFKISAISDYNSKYKDVILENITLTGIYFNTLSESDICRCKPGADGKRRCSNYQVSVLMFTENTLYVYTSVNSLTSTLKKTEDFKFNYEDIALVNIEQGARGGKGAPVLKIEASDGTSAKLCCENSEQVTSVINRINSKR
jgi:hypothetical protein